MTLKELIEKVESFADLRKGWNSYKADGPSALAISVAVDLLRQAEMEDYQADWVGPSAIGGIGIGWKTGWHTDAYVEVHNDGKIWCLLSDEDLSEKNWHTFQVKQETFLVNYLPEIKKYLEQREKKKSN